MSVGDFPPPLGIGWSDAIGWYRTPCLCALCTDSFRPVFVGMDFGREPGVSVPNRLMGSTVLENGDAT